MARSNGRKPRRCNIGGLIIIPTELDAKIALMKRQAKDKGEKRYFPCRNHFHLTAQEQRTEVQS